MTGEAVPCEWVEGPEETTLWLWPDTPDPVTIRFDRAEWNRFKQRAEQHADGDIQRVITSLIRGAAEGDEDVLDLLRSGQP